MVPSSLSERSGRVGSSSHGTLQKGPTNRVPQGLRGCLAGVRHPIGKERNQWEGLQTRFGMRARRRTAGVNDIIFAPIINHLIPVSCAGDAELWTKFGASASPISRPLSGSKARPAPISVWPGARDGAGLGAPKSMQGKPNLLEKAGEWSFVGFQVAGEPAPLLARGAG
jgi:hypothetical protein